MTNTTNPTPTPDEPTVTVTTYGDGTIIEEPQP